MSGPSSSSAKQCAYPEQHLLCSGLDQFGINRNCNVAAYHACHTSHAKMSPIDFRARSRARVEVSFGVLHRISRAVDIQNNLLRHSMNGQIAYRLQLAGALRFHKVTFSPES